jgi:hypothetical protein
LTTKNAGKLLAILIALRMQWYDVGHITWWSTFRATLKATGCRHWVSACAALSRQQAAGMVDEFVENTQNTNKTQLLASNFGTFRSLVVHENFNLKRNPLISSLMQQAE